MRADRTLLPSLLGALLGAAALSACDSARPVGGSPPTAVCVACHGGVESQTGAPPRALDGTNTAAAVGAHTAHLASGQVQCADCHLVPATASDRGHRTRPDGTADGDNRAEVTFGDKARLVGSTPSYDPVSFTCSGVYCHKSFPGGQGPAAPIWNQPLNGGACQGCHGLPPANHRSTLVVTDCVACHATTVDAAGAIVPNGTHIDGQVNAVASCTGCHGDEARQTGEANKPAPPVDLAGNQASNRVGAHQAHLGTDVQCTDCHVVPATIRDAGHRSKANGTPDDDGHADVTFGERARLENRSPTYDPATLTCNSVYCHKTFQGGQGPAAPVWFQPLNGGACQGCHGAPPANHRQTITLTDCATCHDTTVTPAGAILAGGTHIDGVVNAAAGCTGCHGDETRVSIDLNKAAPPVDAAGNPASAAVGAHQAHLVAGRLRLPMNCTECHVPPADTNHSNGVTDLSFANGVSDIARNDGATPAWNQAGGTCSGVYCHGATLHGGSNKVPLFAGGPGEVGIGAPDGAARCGVCHGFPPANGVPPDAFSHPQEAAPGVAFTTPAQCNVCHPQTVDAAGVIQLATHINGQLDGGGHVPGFRDPANPAFHGPSALANLDACRACHGADFGTIVNATTTPPKSCNSCHANPQAFGLAGYGTHANWQTECTFCHGSANRAEDPGFPLVGEPGINEMRANKAGPPAVTGRHLVGAGAHQAHFDVNVNPARRFSDPLVCTNCHGSPLPSNLDHVVGQVVANWGPLAQTDGAIPTPAAFTTAWEGTPTCTNYCHGATLPGGTKTNPNWLEGQAGAFCGSCHAVPLPYSAAGGFHVPNPDCGRCHTGYTSTSVEKSTHVDGLKTVVALTCTTCHGTAGRVGIAGADADVAAAPPGTTAGLPTGVRVGAHQAHVNANNLRATPLVCVDCHGTKPGNPRHANGVVANGFGALAQTNTTALPTTFDAAWEAAPTCTNYCHGATLAGGTVPSPNWTQGASQAQCGACHAIPMPYTAAGGFHVENDNCGGCHPGYTSASVAGAKATHINGAADLVPGFTCTNCHSLGAPFTATTGATAASDVRVGAHNRHLQATNITAVIGCGDCHSLPSGVQHANGVVNVAWGTRAKAGGVTPLPVGPIPTGTAVNCTNYCHGAALPAASGTIRNPSWTGTLTGCNTCHRSPGEGEHRNGKHDGYACYECHNSVMTTATNTTISVPALHINGARDVQARAANGTSFTKSGTTWSCANGCHGNGTTERSADW